MEQVFKLNDEIRGLKWTVASPKAIIIIAHGMAEHASRYGRFAEQLNKRGYSAYAIDHIGHGIPPLHKKGHFDPGDFELCVDHIRELARVLSEKEKVKIALLGHSMGSFVAQRYIEKYGDSLYCCILSGSNGPSALFKMGTIAAAICGFGRRKDEPSPVMNKLSFGTYNSAFKPTRTEFDWLSRDEAEVDKYIADPDCGFICTRGFFKEMMGALAALHKSENVESIPKDLPILIMSGSADSVGGEKGTKVLLDLYKTHNLTHITRKLYEGGRHEMLNEINRDEVMKDLIDYLDAQL